MKTKLEVNAVGASIACDIDQSTPDSVRQPLHMHHEKSKQLYRVDSSGEIRATGLTHPWLLDLTCSRTWLACERPDTCSWILGLSDLIVLQGQGGWWWWGEGRLRGSAPSHPKG